jgi:hypothetical protein
MAHQNDQRTLPQYIMYSPIQGSPIANTDIYPPLCCHVAKQFPIGDWYFVHLRPLQAHPLKLSWLQQTLPYTIWGLL